MYRGRICLLIGFLAATAGNLHASAALTLVCNLTVAAVSVPSGVLDANGCFQTSFINANVMDSLDWGAPTAVSGQSGLGAAIAGNSFPLSTSSAVAIRTATVNNDQIAIQLAPGYSSPPGSVTRTDDFYWQWNGIRWVRGSSLTPAMEGFPGHFDSASATSLSTASPTNNAQLLESSSGAPLELTFLGEPAYGVWFQIASLSGVNSLFTAEVQAFNSSGNSIGSYQLAESGSYGSGGLCQSVAANHPMPCNDAPYVGFYDPQGRISSIYISVFNPGSLSPPIGFAIDSVLVDTVPEPAMLLMIGSGLAAIALYGRKRRARSG